MLRANSKAAVMTSSGHAAITSDSCGGARATGPWLYVNAGAQRCDPAGVILQSGVAHCERCSPGQVACVAAYFGAVRARCCLAFCAKVRVSEDLLGEHRVSSDSVHAIEAHSANKACICKTLATARAGCLRFCGAARAVAAQTLICRLLFLSLARPRVLLLQMVRGPKKHLKRLNAPRHWMLDKLGGVFAPKPAPGAHAWLFCVACEACFAAACSLASERSDCQAVLALVPGLASRCAAGGCFAVNPRSELRDLLRRSTQVSGVPAFGADCAQPTEVCAHVQGGDVGGQVAGHQG